jgi:Xaa-Pro aminopeptidase
VIASDITRTVHNGSPSAFERLSYTLVLRGHIGLARAVFPPGTPGTAIDALARAPLWAAGLNYAHGTGHGVGAFLNVHEGTAWCRDVLCWHHRCLFGVPQLI